MYALLFTKFSIVYCKMHSKYKTVELYTATASGVHLHTKIHDFIVHIHACNHMQKYKKEFSSLCPCLKNA